jgi:hypothetical protein
MKNVASRTAAAAIAAGLAFGFAAPAMAGDNGEVRREGNCSSGTDWKLKAKPDDGRLEVEGEVDSNRNGQVWRWKILHDGNVSAKGRATTHGPSGSFEVERRVVNASGTDRIGWRAVNVNSGERCSVGLRI